MFFKRQLTSFNAKFSESSLITKQYKYFVYMSISKSHYTHNLHMNRHIELHVAIFRWIGFTEMHELLMGIVQKK